MSGFVRETAGKLGGEFATCSRQTIEAALLYDNARRLEATGRVGMEITLERFAPAIEFDQRSCPSVGLRKEMREPAAAPRCGRLARRHAEGC